MNIGFIGCGNMARAIIKGIIKNSAKTFKEVYAYDILQDSLRAFAAESGIRPTDSLDCLIAASDVVVLAVKPQVFGEILPTISKSLKDKNPLIVSIAAGKTTHYISSFLEYKARIGRIFPNLNAEVGQSVSAYCVSAHARKSDLDILKILCESFGAAVHLSEESFSVFGVLSGCAPAYSFLYISALANMAAQKGLDSQESLKIACQVALGSAMTLLKTGEAPEDLISKVCSPGGTTIEGIKVLKNEGFEEIIGRAFEASLNRDKELQ